MADYLTNTLSNESGCKLWGGEGDRPPFIKRHLPQKIKSGLTRSCGILGMWDGV
ncbi:MAG: hypothetical protein KME20_22315 [Kaiparowitsia implicata GSE-PSE-MK54-09C]|nr:hypothetical protein [Kaiparowitsia implicata GSE-PSE-MK54-09C]